MDDVCGNVFSEMNFTAREIMKKCLFMYSPFPQT